MDILVKTPREIEDRMHAVIFIQDIVTIRQSCYMSDLVQEWIEKGMGITIALCASIGRVMR